jgi:hypothetical protein
MGHGDAAAAFGAAWLGAFSSLAASQGEPENAIKQRLEHHPFKRNRLSG